MQLRHLMIAVAALAVTGGASSTALARAGFATADVNMRAGPSTGFPVVTTIPDGAGVNIHGCVADYGWCDVGWGGARGWVSGAYLQFIYNDRRVLVPYYGPRIGLPIIAFSVDTYWRHHYRHRPWYHRRAYWHRHYHRHQAQPHHRDRRDARPYRGERHHVRPGDRYRRSIQRHDRDRRSHIERRGNDRGQIHRAVRHRDRNRTHAPDRSRSVQQRLIDAAKSQMRQRQGGGHRGAVRDY
jgi:uncharacterized protein YraI